MNTSRGVVGNLPQQFGQHAAQGLVIGLHDVDQQFGETGGLTCKLVKHLPPKRHSHILCVGWVGCVGCGVGWGCGYGCKCGRICVHSYTAQAHVTANNTAYMHPACISQIHPTHRQRTDCRCMCSRNNVSTNRRRSFSSPPLCPTPPIIRNTTCCLVISPVNVSEKRPCVGQHARAVFSIPVNMSVNVPWNALTLSTNSAIHRGGVVGWDAGCDAA